MNLFKRKKKQEVKIGKIIIPEQKNMSSCPIDVKIEQARDVAWMDGKYAKSFWVMEEFFSSRVLGMNKAKFYEAVASFEMSDKSDAAFEVMYRTRGALSPSIKESWLTKFVFDEMKLRLNATIDCDIEKTYQIAVENFNRWANVLNPECKLTVEELKESDRKEVYNKFKDMFINPNPKVIV